MKVETKMKPTMKSKMQQNVKKHQKASKRRQKASKRRQKQGGSKCTRLPYT